VALAPSMALAAGNVDHDGDQELLVIRNAIDDTTAASAYALLDDAAGGFAELSSGTPHGITGTGPDGVDHVMVVANGVLADVDGDNLDEVVFGGLEFVTSGSSCEPIDYLLVALDDQVAGLDPLGVLPIQHVLTECLDAFPQTVRWAFLHGLDVTRDARAEILLNGFLFDYSVTDGAFRRLATLEDQLFLAPREQTRRSRASRAGAPTSAASSRSSART